MGTGRRLLGYVLAVFCISKLFVSITGFFKIIIIINNSSSISIIIIMNTPLVNIRELRLTLGTLAWVPEDAYSVMCWLYSV